MSLGRSKLSRLGHHNSLGNVTSDYLPIFVLDKTVSHTRYESIEEASPNVVDISSPTLDEDMPEIIEDVSSVQVVISNKNNAITFQSESHKPDQLAPQPPPQHRLEESVQDLLVDSPQISPSVPSSPAPITSPPPPQPILSSPMIIDNDEQSQMLTRNLTPPLTFPSLPSIPPLQTQDQIQYLSPFQDDLAQQVTEIDRITIHQQISLSVQNTLTIAPPSTGTHFPNPLGIRPLPTLILPFSFLSPRQDM